MISDPARDVLQLTLTPGVGPILCRRIIQRFGSAGAALAASPAQLQEVQGIGKQLGPAIARGVREAQALVAEELDLAQRLGVRLLALGEPDYPELLAQIPDAPPILYVRGTLEPRARDRYSVGIVGSRDATAYGIEQGERFAGGLARAGLTIVSGGARGIDTAAHRGALRAGGRTTVVLGCGLGECYPPENAELFARIAEAKEGSGGAIVSELPLRTPPTADNFPARNRLISGLSLGVIVIEAGQRSGSLITARLAAEEHGREVMAVPGRVDSPTSKGTHELLKSGGAALVTEPGDVLEVLRGPARHSFEGTHADRYADPSRAPRDSDGLFAGSTASQSASPPRTSPNLSDAQQRVLAALDSARTLDEIVAKTGLDPAKLRAEITALEMLRQVRRTGTRIERANAAR